MAKISRVRVTDTTEYNSEVPEDNEELQGSERPLRTGVNRPAVSSGWGSPAEERVETVRAVNLVLKDKGKRIIKILDEVPPVKYKRHYLNSKKRYYTCLQTACPLCQAKVRASWTFMVNVIDMTDDPSEIKAWTFGNEVATQLQSHAEDRDLTDPKWYFHVYHEKIANRDAPATRVLPLKARDVEEDYGIQTLTESDLENLDEEKYGNEIVFINTLDYLEVIASEVLPSDLPQKRDQ